VNTSETWDNPRLFKMIRGMQPQVMITTRCGGLAHGGDWGDFDSPEQRVGGFQMDPPWETCMTICRQWAWKPNDSMKSLEQCLRALISSAGGDGNFLFNVGPQPDGAIEARQVERLKEMGAWLQTNGESIYGTRGGPYKPGKSYVTTRKGNTIYLHVLKWPEGGIQLPALPAKIIGSSLLAGGGKPVVSQTAEGVTVNVTEGRQPIDTVVKLEIDQPALALAPIDPLPAEASNPPKNK
jgi:alpha-L-fucosidase